MIRSPAPACAAALLIASGCIPGDRAAPPEHYTADPIARTPRTEQVVVPAAAKVAPAWAARQVTPDAIERRPSIYLVRQGDTLRIVADRTGAGSEAIARDNDIPPPFTIRAGERLRIPGGRWHRVKSGETGIAIARAYGVDWSEVTSVNHLQEPFILRVGQRLLLPSRAEVSTMSLEERAQAFRVDIDDLITGGEPALAANETAVAPVAGAKRRLPPDATVGEPADFSGRFAWPVTGPILARFGTLGNGRRSNGINIAAPLGTPVLAAADGVVAYVGALGSYGGLVLLRHGDGWITAYGNAEELLVTRGQAVKRGQPIARAGETGMANAPQVHFEIRSKRVPVDPLRYLPAS